MSATDEAAAAVADARSAHAGAAPPHPAAGRDTSGSGTVLETIRVHAQARPEHPAIVGSDAEPLSYGSLLEEIERARGVLRSAGYGRDARVAVAIAGSPEASRVIVAVACSASSVPVDPKLAVPEVGASWTLLRPDAVVLRRGAPSAARSVAEQRSIPVIEADFTPGLALSAPPIGDAAPAGEPDPDAPAFILRTSGTTGEPNLVPFSHRNLLACVERLRTWYGLTPGDCCLTATPVHYSHALTTTVFPPLMTGGTVAFPSNPTSVDAAEWFARLRPTWYSAGPTLHLAILEKIEAHEGPSATGTLRFVSTAGAPLAPEIHLRLQRALGVPVLEHYGSSETAQVASNAPPPGPSKTGTCGMPWPGILKIAGPDGGALPAGQRGDILVRGPSVMAGYLNASGGAAIGRDGWYRTGDIGSLDPDGFLTLHGREKELINRGGEKISPVEIDQALMRHPAVAQAAAFGVPHPRLGEDVAAAIVLRPGATATASELRDFVGGQLAAFKAPRRITIVAELPTGPSGKVMRQRLAETLRPRPERAGLSEEHLQAQLATLWKRMLKTDRIGLDDDFFEAGGDSLLAMDLSLELQRMTGRDLSESLLFDAPTIRELAKSLADEGNPAG